MTSKAVEHLVLFNTKPGTDPSKIEALISGLNAFSSLPTVIFLASGTISTNQSHPFNFTHFVHGRFHTKADLDAYARHPAHRSFAKQFFLPLCADYLIADWEFDVDGPIVPSPGSTIRITLLKPREDHADADKETILTVLGEISRSALKKVDQLSLGENFSKIGHKGFTVASLSTGSGPQAVKALDEMVEMQKERAKGLMESIITVDYEIPALTPSKL
ncbi:hypothetical protein ACLOJK_040573 [Asimina triloba]